MSACWRSLPDSTGLSAPKSQQLGDVLVLIILAANFWNCFSCAPAWSPAETPAPSPIRLRALHWQPRLVTRFQTIFRADWQFCQLTSHRCAYKLRNCVWSKRLSRVSPKRRTNELSDEYQDIRQIAKEAYYGFTEVQNGTWKNPPMEPVRRTLGSMRYGALCLLVSAVLSSVSLAQVSCFRDYAGRKHD